MDHVLLEQADIVVNMERPIARNNAAGGWRAQVINICRNFHMELFLYNDRIILKQLLIKTLLLQVQ